MEQWVTIISLIINFITTGGLIAIFTLKPSIKKADAEAAKVEADVESVKIANEKDAIDVYKQLAEDLRKELVNSKSANSEILAELANVRKESENLRKESENLRKEVVKLTNVNRQMVKLLDKITPENLTEIVDKIKQIHNNE